MERKIIEKRDCSTKGCNCKATYKIDPLGDYWLCKACMQDYKHKTWPILKDYLVSIGFTALNKPYPIFKYKSLIIKFVYSRSGWCYRYTDEIKWKYVYGEMTLYPDLEIISDRVKDDIKLLMQHVDEVQKKL